MTTWLVRAGTLLAFAGAALATEFDSYTFGGMSARSIGPAVMSGRIAAIDAVPGDPLVVYAGAASGGVWKSTNGGLTFTPVFDEHPQSIGAIRVAPSDPEVIWVGTGESWVRNSVSHGDGVYRSSDGGKSWEHAGLPDSERIAAIRVHPERPEEAWVCVLGRLWSDSDARGVYHTEDAGATWTLQLAVDERTGCADLDMDPRNPNILFAGMWSFRRYPDFFESGGEGSGLYRSIDGGRTWERLEDGLPESELGRIAVAIAPSRPGTVYATVEYEDTALFRSDDLGATWERLDDSNNIQMRPFYFSELVVDPTDHQRVYKPGYTLTVSTDGGKSFSSMFGPGFNVTIHPDHHALWIDPRNPHRLILGTDGGVYVSEDRAAHWRLVGTLPISQFYHVSHDLEWPYNVYGGLQDNGSWMGPSRAPGGIRNRDWDNVGFGDGFWVFADPEDPDHVYSEYQGGRLMRVNHRLGEVRHIAPIAGEGEEELRFNWNTPLLLSAHHPGRLYYGSQYLHVSDDRGESWRTLSPDLTTDNPARQRQLESGGLTIDNSTAENNATLYTIAESPVDGDVLWVGSDDGLVHVTGDGGKNWENVTRRIPGLPEGTWVSRVHASSHGRETAFVTFDGHRTGDFETYLFRTDDLGRSWTRLDTGDVEGYAWVIVQDPVNAQLLFLGTELGLYVSLDGAGNWARFREGLPRVAVHDLVIHPTEHDLIVGTHGRGVFIIDDLTPLRSLSTESLASNVALLESRPAVMVAGGALQVFGGHEGFTGQNPPEAAWIAYYLRKRHLFGDLQVRVFDESGELITTLPGGKRRGINRVAWPMRLKPPKFPPSTSLVPGFLGPRVPEGSYRFELVKGKEVLEGEVELVADPRSPHTQESRRAQQALAMHLYRLLGDLTYLAESIADLSEQAAARRAELSGRGERLLRDLERELAAVSETLAVTSDAGMLSGQEKLREKFGALYGDVTSYDGRPTQTQEARAKKLEGELQLASEKAEALLDEALPEINRVLEGAGMAPLVRMSRGDWEAAEGGVSAGPATGTAGAPSWSMLLRAL